MTSGGRPGHLMTRLDATWYLSMTDWDMQLGCRGLGRGRRTGGEGHVGGWILHLPLAALGTPWYPPLTTWEGRQQEEDKPSLPHSCCCCCCCLACLAWSAAPPLPTCCCQPSANPLLPPTCCLPPAATDPSHKLKVLPLVPLTPCLAPAVCVMMAAAAAVVWQANLAAPAAVHHHGVCDTDSAGGVHIQQQ